MLPWPSDSQKPQAVIYSDAFFTLGDRSLKAGEAPDLWHPGKRRPSDNGRGFVAQIGDNTFYAFGKIPEWFVSSFTTRRAGDCAVWLDMRSHSASLVRFPTNLQKVGKVSERIWACCRERHEQYVLQHLDA